MKRIFLLCQFLIVFPISAQTSNSLLWRVSGKEIKNPSFLYGTIHTICQDSVSLPNDLTKIIKSSENLFLEIVYEESLNDYKDFFDNYLKNGKKLMDYYTEKQYLYLEKMFNKEMKSKELKLHYFENFKPSKILFYLVPQYLGCGKPTSVEAIISKVARKNNVPILGLESYEIHNSFVDESDSTIQKEAKELYRIIRRNENMREYYQTYQKVLGMYKSQNIEEIYNLSVEKNNSISPEKILDYRNEQWIPKIIAYSTQGQNFFAFGAAHLAGKNGIISLLRKAGYTVEPVK